MKKIFTIFCFILLTLNSYTQTCEEREGKMLTIIGGFSAGLLYNTYGVIGSVADGFMKDAYTGETVTNLMNAQKAMADNFIKMMNNNLKENVFTKEADITYMKSAIEIIKGLKLQAGFLIDLTEVNSNKKRDEYETQRQKNWSSISKLMGIEE